MLHYAGACGLSGCHSRRLGDTRSPPPAFGGARWRSQSSCGRHLPRDDRCAVRTLLLSLHSTTPLDGTAAIPASDPRLDDGVLDVARLASSAECMVCGCDILDSLRSPARPAASEHQLDGGGVGGEMADGRAHTMERG